MMPNLINMPSLFRIRWIYSILSAWRLTNITLKNVTSLRYPICLFSRVSNGLRYETLYIYYTRYDTSSSEINFILEWKKSQAWHLCSSPFWKMVNDQQLAVCCLGCLAISENILWIYIQGKRNWKEYRVIISVFLPSFVERTFKRVRKITFPNW